MSKRVEYHFICESWKLFQKNGRRNTDLVRGHRGGDGEKGKKAQNLDRKKEAKKPELSQYSLKKPSGKREIATHLGMRGGRGER